MRTHSLVLLDVLSANDIDGLLDGKRLSSGSRLGRDQEVGEKKKKKIKKRKKEERKIGILLRENREFQRDRITESCTEK